MQPHEIRELKDIINRLQAENLALKAVIASMKNVEIDENKARMIINSVFTPVGTGITSTAMTVLSGIITVANQQEFGAVQK